LFFNENAHLSPSKRAKVELRDYLGTRSIGPRPSEKPAGRERRRGNATENIGEEEPFDPEALDGRHGPPVSQPVEWHSAK